MTPCHFRHAPLLLLGLAAGLAAAQQQPPAAGVEAGRIEYRSNCAACHGVSGRGDGPLRPYLVQPPADLTTLARRHGGSFPTELVWETIDGRGKAPAGAHGPSEMPVWGNEFRAEAQANPRTAEQAERVVRDRIVSLLAYLASLQQK